MNKFILFILLYGFLLNVDSSLLAKDRVDYLKQVKHLLAEKCYACHSALKEEAGLRLETKSLMLKGGDSGPVLVPGSPNKSLMLERVLAIKDEQMPPPEEGTRLTPKETSLLKRWIQQGAIAPDEKVPGSPRDHWAFRPPKKTELIPIDKSKGIENPIDRILAVQRSQKKLIPVSPASKRFLLRRVYLDLIGLPPTRKELHDFLNDNSENAYHKVVTKLLASPQYGERWGRHWMDIWRYADWYGLGSQIRYSQKHIWHWRDWIIESLNKDKSYGQMIEEMLAADEIAPLNRDTLRATGFLVRHYYLFNRTTWLDSTIEHTSKAFLGLTMNCTKCHDHKYDPISQVDYYRMRAIFEPHQIRHDALPGQINLDKDGIPRAFDAHPDAPTYVHIRGNPKTPNKEIKITPGIPVLFTFSPLKISQVALPLEAYRPAYQPYVIKDYLNDAKNKIQSAQTNLKNANAQLAKTPWEPVVANKPGKVNTPPHVTQFDIAKLVQQIAEKKLSVAKQYLMAIETAHAADLEKRNPTSKKKLNLLCKKAALTARNYELATAQLDNQSAIHKSVTAKDEKTKQAALKEMTTAKTAIKKAKEALKKPGMKYFPIRGSRKSFERFEEKDESRYKPYPKTSTGRRTAFARWITHRKNPLTARVAVNHIWSRHFGQPLVDNVTDFGLRTDAPSQQTLLDWLAVDFMEHNWSMKYLHQLIVTSNAYQLGSSTLYADPVTLKTDPNNHYYWRRQPVRMESEVIRDSLLYMANSLDLTLGGPTINNPNINRRTLYFTTSRDQKNKFASMFDAADILSCYQRNTSIIPQQALTLANSRLSLTMARKITAHLQKELATASDEQFVTTAFETILAVKPSQEELLLCLDSLRQTRAVLLNDKKKNPVIHARINLVHALINHNDFITIR